MADTEVEDDITDDKNSPDEDEVKDKINNEDKKRKTRKRSNSPPCRPRIDILSTPNRRLILDLYQKHAYHLSKEKVEKIKELLQELYAMTPEETKRYFMELELENNKKRRRKRIKEMLRRQYLKQKRQHDTAKAYRKFTNILRNGIKFAITHSVPPLVSVRLRNLSDIVLEQICDLRNIRKPDRDTFDRQGRFMIAVADWIAVGIEQVYFNVQVKKNEELLKLEQEKEQLEGVKNETQPTPQETAESNTKTRGLDPKWDNELELEENEWDLE